MSTHAPNPDEERTQLRAALLGLLGGINRSRFQRRAQWMGYPGWHKREVVEAAAKLVDLKGER